MFCNNDNWSNSDINKIGTAYNSRYTPMLRANYPAL